MTEIEISGNQYRIGRLNAVVQFHITRRIAPALAGLADMAGDENKVLASLTQAIGKMSDEDADYVLFGLMAAASRRIDGGGWSPVAVKKTLAYDDITMPDMIRLAVAAFQSNFGDFFAGLLQTSVDLGSAQKDRSAG